MRTTKIVATLGPATDSAEKLRKLLEAGVNVVRLNASHGSQADHARRIQAVRALAAETGVNAGILLDLQGPKIRLGTFQNEGCFLEEGSVFTITTAPVEGTNEIASTTYPEFARDVKPGDNVLLADGTVQLEVIATDGVSAKCKVIRGGWVGDRKGINLPGVHVSTPSLSEKDVADAHFGVEHGVDFIALSFVRTGKDVLRLRHLLDERNANQPIIAKIEKPEAWQNLDSIIEEADGVMVARGDLGVEMALERVPMIQKAIIEQCRQAGRFVITATQMLESMVENPVPTRAEVSDVANAIYDGTSALMLSAETSIGKFPIEAIQMMGKIALETEAAVRRQGFTREMRLASNATTPQIIADAAFHVARSADVSAIAVTTTSGATAKLLARYRPRVPIFAFTPSEAVARRLSIVYGVEAIVAPACTSTDKIFEEMEKALVATERVKPGDNMVFVAGQPMNQPGSTNLLNLHRVSPTSLT
jgi:pyruvate kinase